MPTPVEDLLTRCLGDPAFAEEMYRQALAAQLAARRARWVVFREVFEARAQTLPPLVRQAYADYCEANQHGSRNAVEQAETLLNALVVTREQLPPELRDAINTELVATAERRARASAWRAAREARVA